jgi:tetratricopeptide (TPR) repeat protein
MQIHLLLLVCLLMVQASAVPISAQPTPPGQVHVRSLAELKKKIEGDNRDHPVASVRWAEEALRELADKPDTQSEIWFLTSLMDDFIVLSDYPKAEACLEQGRKVVTRSRDQRSHFLLEIRAAALVLHTGKPRESKLLLDGLLPSMESHRSKNLQDREIGRTLGAGYRFLGMALQMMGRYSEAIGAYQKAQKITEEMGDRREQSITLNQMGTLYAVFDRMTEAVASHQQAIQMAEVMEDRALQAAFHLDLANTYRLKNNLEAQLGALNHALALARKAENVSFQIAGMVNLADVYLCRKDFKAALQHADAALKLPGIFEDPGNVAVCQVNRGIALNRLGKNTEGLEALEEGLRYIKTTQDRRQIAEIAFAGDFRKAYATEREFKVLSDELKRTADQKHVAEASAAFESDKQQIQIEGLQRERRHQLRLTMLWIALGVLGFSMVGVLVARRKKLQEVNSSLMAMNDQNLDLIDQLQSALSEVRTLQGLIPICAHCKKIRDDEGYWNQMETYIQSRTGAQFTHGMCPDCYAGLEAEFDRLYPDKT